MSQNGFVVHGFLKCEKEDDVQEDKLQVDQHKKEKRKLSVVKEVDKRKGHVKKDKRLGATDEDSDWEDLHLVAVVEEYIDDETGDLIEEGSGEAKEQRRKGGFIVTNPLHKYCRDLITDYSNVSCAECGMKPKLYTRGQLHIHRLIIHASVHLGIKMYACRECKYDSVSESAVRTHIVKVHDLENSVKNYVDPSAQYENELMEALRKCFRKTENGNEEGCGADYTHEQLKDMRIKRKIQTLSKGDELHVDKLVYCLDLLRKFKDGTGKVRCQLCSQELGACRKDGLKSDKALRHALLHLDKPLYRCKKCKKTTSTLETMRIHLKQGHKIKIFHGRYEDLSGEYHSLILRILSECYDPTDDGADF